MISSGVTPLGGALSRGPSCASASELSETQTARNRKRGSKKIPCARFISLFYRIIADGEMKNCAGALWSDTAVHRPRQPSPDPSPLSEAGGRALQFCRKVGCDINQEVAVVKSRAGVPRRQPVLRLCASLGESQED